MAVLVLFLCLLLVSCGGASSPPPAPSPSNPNTITITGAGVSPKELTVPPGTRVLFLNSDTRRHEMTSDPHLEHSDCPEFNPVGALNPGQGRETGNLVDVRTCLLAGSTTTANLTIPA
jgi:plastocyanin